ncbi:Putative phage protein [Cronobacter phage Dev2]|uniref:Putative phage protein n=1 Tax=Cronobacter phage Dev2 TaxID=1410331 RepID=W6PDA2_9CAUD|nr:hypothetical protein BN930_gp07 [Cronobacter phage Dev2]CDM12531.1 Putative phage protein [Cronobacter phage Dev2]
MFFNSMLKQRITELEQQLKNDREVIGYLKEANKRRAASEESLHKQLEEYRKPQAIHHAERMVGIKFKALFNGLYQPTEFKTGPGPCGKTVTYFTTTRDDRHLTIVQKHTDGSHKKFIYRLSDIDGRIQEDWELVQLVGKEAEDAKRLEEAARIIIPRFA